MSLYFPASHAVQAWPSGPVKPALHWQSVTLSEPGDEDAFGGHAVQPSLLEPDLYVCAGHCTAVNSVATSDTRVLLADPSVFSTEAVTSAASAVYSVSVVSISVSTSIAACPSRSRRLEAPSVTSVTCRTTISTGSTPSNLPAISCLYAAG
jgi:hypothetical protein